MKMVYFLVKFFKEKKHADDFVRGRIYVNRLSRFKKVEDDDGSGRVDRYEGTIAWMQPGETGLVINGMDLSEDLAGPLLVQKDWLNHLNVYCIHAGHSGDLNLSSLSNDNIAALQQELTIHDRCLSLGKYAVVVTNVPEFIQRMGSSAGAEGYEIGWGLGKYYDPATFHGNFRDIESVFWKQEQYSFQREFRFVINCRTLGKSPLEMDIGDITHITLQFESTELNSEKWLGGSFNVPSVRSTADIASPHL